MNWQTLQSDIIASRQNTQTGRLTPAMFEAIWTQVRALLAAPG